MLKTLTLRRGALKKINGMKNNLSEEIRNWVTTFSSGWFTTAELDRDLNIVTSQGKTLRRVVLKALYDEGVLVRDSQRSGRYRIISEGAPVLEWQDADESNYLNIEYPFKLHELIRTYPKNLIVLAGSPDAGKSAFCFDFIKRNMKRWPIVYFTSEMGAEELKVRLSKFDIPLDEWQFEARERSSNFADVIYPDWINIIDYIEITSGEFFLMANELRMIFDKLNKGVALVTLQKKRGVELGRGAEFSLEKPRLYLSMDSGRLRIVKAKNWVNGTVNPNGLAYSYKLVDGCKFVNIQESEY